MGRQIELSCQNSFFLTGLGLHWVLSVSFTMTVACHRLRPFIPSYSASSVAFGTVRVPMYRNARQPLSQTGLVSCRWLDIFLCLITRTIITATNEIVMLTIKNL